MQVEKGEGVKYKGSILRGEVKLAITFATICRINKISKNVLKLSKIKY